MSDHGFAPFSRELHLSTWLVENGFMAVTDKSKFHSSQFYQYVDWSKTKAYVMGLNGIYINLEGRDKRGSVSPNDMPKIKQEIINKLTPLQDPKTGRRAITQVYDSAEIYRGPYVGLAPDLVVGYESGYRISDESVLGKFPEGIFADRTDPWAADHCMDPSHVPGVLLSNKSVRHPTPALWDLAPTILREFGYDAPREMEGKPIFAA
jgi:predicted AlkP superfamily phosphohydrolase/phosphomutase